MTKDFPELSLPRWVPDYAARYLQHIENGKSIRDLAREVGCHASTILRQIRRTESRRDDPLVDSALSMLASKYCCSAPVISTAGEWCGSRTRNTIKMQANPVSATSLPDTRKLQTEAIRILRRLCESGAVLAVAENMEKAVVVRDDDSGSSTRTAVVDNGIAQAMALKDWITCSAPGRISRYYITATGRTALSQMLAEQENRVRSERELGRGLVFRGAGQRGGDHHRRRVGPEHQVHGDARQRPGGHLPVEQHRGVRRHLRARGRHLLGVRRHRPLLDDGSPR